MYKDNGTFIIKVLHYLSKSNIPALKTSRFGVQGLGGKAPFIHILVKWFYLSLQ
jgi:hypothetical protein